MSVSEGGTPSSPRTASAAPAKWVLFHSHAWADKASVLPLKAGLDSIGYPGWIDHQHVDGGDSLWKEITIGIDSAEVVLLYISPSYLNRLNCSKEVSLAVDYGKKVLPILLPGAVWPVRPSHGEFAADIAPHLTGKLYIAADAEGVVSLERVVAALLKGGLRPTDEALLPAAMAQLSLSSGGGGSSSSSSTGGGGSGGTGGSGSSSTGGGGSGSSSAYSPRAATLPSAYTAPSTGDDYPRAATGIAHSPRVQPDSFVIAAGDTGVPSQPSTSADRKSVV